MRVHAYLFTWIYSQIQAIVVVIRRVYFHPLKGVPGPLLAKVSDAYSAYYSYRGDMHLDVQRCHRKYGSSTYRSGEYSINNLQGTWFDMAQTASLRCALRIWIVSGPPSPSMLPLMGNKQSMAMDSLFENREDMRLWFQCRMAGAPWPLLINLAPQLAENIQIWSRC